MSDQIDQIAKPPSNASPVTPGTPDKHGTPFDQAKHIPRMNPRTGRWMPRPPRGIPKRPKAASSSSPSTSGEPGSTGAPTAPAPSQTSFPFQPVSPAAPASPEHVTAAEIVADTFPKATVPPPASSNAGNGAERSTTPAPGASFIPDAPPPAPAETVATAKVEVVDNVDGQADTVWRGLYSFFGVVTGAPEETTRTGAAHANNRDALAAWMRESGIRIKGIWGLLLVLFTYIFETANKPKTKSRLAKWKAWLFPAKPAPVDVAAAVDDSPASAPVSAPVQSPAPASEPTSLLVQ